MSSRYAQIKALFLAALDVPAAERAAFVEARAGGDRALADEVSSLLAHHGEPILREPAARSDATTPGVSAAGTSAVRAAVGRAVDAASVPDPLHAAMQVIAGRYRVHELVAEGGFSVVYRGEQVTDGRAVALKFFREQRTGQRAALERAFVAESALLGELSRRTPTIVRSIDAGTWSHRGQAWLYTVLEWLEGETLARRLARERAAGAGGWPIAQVVDVLDPIAEALAVACDLGIAHRDVKPGNIFLAAEPGDDARTVPKLIDFGTAKVASNQAGFDVASSVIGVFTVAYAAPEQLQRELGPTGPWTDVYAFALLCVELLLGRAPFSRHDLAMMLRRVIAGEDLAPRDFDLALPAPLDAVLTTALATAPRRRHPDVRTFWAALRAAVAA